MGHVEDRWWWTGREATRVARDRCGVGLRWRARYRDADGAHRARPFALKKDALRFLILVRADLPRGSYVDPGLSRRSLRSYVVLWLPAQPVRASTRRTYDSHLRNHILPVLGHRSLQSLTPTDVRGPVRSLTEHLAPRTAWHVHGLLATILRAAVEDGWLARSPCRRTGPPKPRQARVIPLTGGQVQALLDALPPAYRVVGLLGAGCGLRVGEVLGLAVSDVDLDEQVLHVSCQLQAEPGGKPQRVAPKSAASVRTVPLPEPVEVDRADELLVLGARGGPVWPRTFHARIWRQATHAAGLPGVRFHDLRHFYASALIAAGESVTTVQAALGYASAVETLDVYAGLRPDRDPAFRTAIDKLLK